MRNGFVRRANARRLSLILCLCSAGADAADSQVTYQGKPLSVWLEAMRHDLDPDYRRQAMEAVTRFGGLAIPRLSEMLYRADDPEGIRIATITLIRMGPAGRTEVGERLTREPKRALLQVINGISQAGPWARSFVPHLRTLANSPEVSLIALRTLAQVDAEPGPAMPDPLVERQWDGPGGSIFLTPLDCFVKGRFSSVRAGLSLAKGATLKRVGMTFKSGLSSDEVFWTPVKPLAADRADRTQYEAVLPSINTLGLTTISYSILAETSAGDVATDYVLAAISPTEEGCLMVGARPLPLAYPEAKVDVILFSKGGKKRP
jgi:hypothetical protein